MTKRTLLERIKKRRKAQLALELEIIEDMFKDSEDLLRVKSDATLSSNQRLQALKQLEMWPRIVGEMYGCQLPIAQNNQNENGLPEYGREEPSETAREEVAEAIGLGPDRVRDLWREGQSHFKEGQWHKPKKNVAEFKLELSTTLSKNDAAKFREGISRRKQQMLSAAMERFSIGETS